MMEECERFCFSVKADQSRLDKALALEFPTLSRARFQDLIKQGQVQVDGKVVEDTSRKIFEGQDIQVQIPPLRETDVLPQKMDLDIVFEDQDILVINKPAGLVVHPGAGNGDGTLVNALLAHCADQLSGIGGVKRPGIVHRLDKQTSGLMLIAKNDESHQFLSKQFETRTLSRVYHALVWGVPRHQKGTVDAPLDRDPKNRQKMAVRSGGRQAVTHYTVLETYGKIAAKLECRLETGRTHQIRVHMHKLGHPVVGDPAYGKGVPPKFLGREALLALPFYGQRQALHAVEITFIHPRSGTSQHFSVPYPEDFIEMESVIKNQ
jgi:23S rRNA pseudouridine1911/1915/1917 synthase